MRYPASVEAVQPEPDKTSRFSKVLVVDDEEPMRHVLDLLLRREGFDVSVVNSAEQALEFLESNRVDAVLSDVRMPGMGGLNLVQTARERYPSLTFIVMSAFGSVDLAIEAMHRGAYDYISKPFKQDEVILALRKAEERERLRRENANLRKRLEEAVADADRLGGMVIHSSGMQAVAKTVRKVAGYRTTVLVQGESGVGKELIAKAIHEQSPRSDGPFLTINCGALPEQILESELFGHVQGAYADAVGDRAGLFEQANGGTLFLDEVGELPTQVQVKLLRALQDGHTVRMGDHTPVEVDVRVVAATSSDLAGAVESGDFRQDLYYRLNVMPVLVPPLRERKDDIAPLIQHFVKVMNERLGTAVQGVSPETLKIMVAYHWPGNVRELENVLEHALVMCEGDWVEPRSLPERAQRSSAPEGGFGLSFPEDDLSVKRAQRKLEREFILRALEKTGGNRTRAAKLLDLSHRALLYKIKEFGLT